MCSIPKLTVLFIRVLPLHSPLIAISFPCHRPASLSRPVTAPSLVPLLTTAEMDSGENMLSDDETLPGDDLTDQQSLEDAKLVENNYTGQNDEIKEKLALEENVDHVPVVGMRFGGLDEVYQFYRQYSYHIGFRVRRRNTRKGKYVTLTCNREGNREYANTRPTCQTGCGARLTAKLDILGTWEITNVILDHNHECISPPKSRFYRCNRKLDNRSKRRLEVDDIVGIPMHKSCNSVVAEVNGYDNMTFMEKGCRLWLGEGDVAVIQGYFKKMQSLCPGFYFGLDLDDDGRLKNVFWCDNRCRHAYREFGDVVIFDTTYLTKKYDMPFVPFVGVNHHGHSILLGCGLVCNKKASTFEWLFETWLACMDGKAPLGIITDQDLAMKSAIKAVFPNTKHRWCLWHILKELPEKFCGHNEKDSIIIAMKKLVHDSLSEEEFEHDWGAMIDTYSLRENEWLSGLYRDRSCWVPCFLKASFWAGMSTTQHSESMNAFFDGYVNSKTSLKLFLEHYEHVLKAKVEKEVQADFKSSTQMIPLVTQFDMEKQFQATYTLKKFKEFHTEFKEMGFCRIISMEEDNYLMKYVILQHVAYEGGMKEKKFDVSFRKKGCDVNCSCHLFEFRGILCRHAIKVLFENSVMSIPEKYILRRWRKDVIRHYTRLKANYNGWISSLESVRYEQIQREFESKADAASKDEELTRMLISWIRELNLSKTTSSASKIFY